MPRDRLLGSYFRTRKQRRYYVLAVATVTAGFLAFAWANPTDRIALVVLFTTAFWLPSIRPAKRRWDPTLPLPQEAKELDERDLLALRAYRLLTFVWVVVATFMVGGLCLEMPYSGYTSWHLPVGVGMYGMAVVSINFPKAYVLWMAPEE